jgi:hypothetical protein
MDVMLNVMHWRIKELEVTWWIQNAAALAYHMYIINYIECYAFHNENLQLGRHFRLGKFSFEGLRPPRPPVLYEICARI